MKKSRKLPYFLISVFAFTVVIIGLFGFLITYIYTKPVDFLNKELEFQNKLSIPPLLESTTEKGVKIFKLQTQAGTTEIFKGKITNTWGFNGSLLGPTIRVNKGEAIRIEVTNNLQEKTTVHWHGMHVPPAMDGGPYQVIEPGQTWSPHWTVENEAATLWYHPHTMGKTAEQVYKGLAGLFIIDDENSKNIMLPQEYGIDDIPLVIQDRKIDDAGQFVYDHVHEAHVMTAGMLGETLLVNGTYGPFVDVPRKQIRLRLLNGSNARRYNFGFSDRRTFYQIASDGGLLPSAVERTTLQLAPGERAEILVNFYNETDSVTLMSYPPVSDHSNKLRTFVLGLIAGGTDENQQFKVLEIRPNGQKRQKETIPPMLNSIEYFQEKDAVKTRLFRLDATSINDQRMDSNRVDEVVTKGNIEIWDVRNESALYHPFHIHGVQFQVLDRNGKRPEAFEQGWKDTISLDSGESARLIMKFPELEDLENPYMYHCHILEHEDMGMMGQFYVVNFDTPKNSLRTSPFSNEPHETH